ncbi:MAG TPA: universal stress protein [Methanotrichaceae archaeon]|nr:universal stress protein [Methanotrichaceae archaeon]
MIKKIMIATDGSMPGRQAAEMGINLAKLAGAEVTAVYVVDMARLTQLPGYISVPGIKERLLELMGTEGEKATAEVEGMANEAGVACCKRVAGGDPADEILKISQELGVDLLVMGSIGRSGLSKILLGSVAEKVVRHSKVPVLLVPIKG